MKHKNLLSKIFLIIVGVAVGIAISLSTKTGAQNDVVTYLEERYKQQNVPVAGITVLQESPLRLQIVFQTTSEGKKGTPDDPINYHLVEREVILAARKGYFIQSFVTIVINPNGEQVFKSDTPVYADPKTLEIAPARIADSDTSKMAGDGINLLIDKLNLHETTAVVDISSSDGFQTLNVQLLTPSLKEAYNAVDLTMSLRNLISETNAQGAQIVMYKVEIKDEKGNILLNYLSDLQLRSESWWNADNFQVDLFPGSPPPAIAPQETNSPTP